jgi:prolyl-tRNA synthetase
MRATRGVEVGNIFKLGTHFTDALGASFTDENGQSRSIIMGSYGIGVGRLLACIAEEHHDEQGLLWPVSVAPYPVHLVLLGSKTGEPERLAEQLYEELCKAGIEPLFDDRIESPGVKFNDADLIGLPLRLTVAERALKNGGVEFKRRSSPDRRIVPLPEVINEVKAELAALQAEIDQIRVQSNG